MRSRLVAEAGESVFKRGLAYWQEQRVDELEGGGDRYDAIVQGSEPYRVQIRVSESRIHGECDCPHAADGFFCKHMVATALAGLSPSSADASAPASVEPVSSPRGARREALLAFLRARDPAWLVDRLLNACERDSVFGAELLFAARLEACGDKAKALERALGEALGTASANPGWQAERRYGQRLDTVIAAVDDLMAAGRIDAARVGATYLYKRVAAVVYRFDDSSGAIGDRGQAIGRLLGRVLRAAPVGKSVALKLVDRLLADEWDWLRPKDYASWFDAEGLIAFEGEIERRWQSLPKERARADGGDDGLALQRWAERIRTRRGETDALVALILARPGLAWIDYSDAAKALVAAGREREAVALLERAVRATGDKQLRLELAAAYWRDGCVEDAEEQLFLSFAAQPSVALLLELRRCAGPRWPTRRLAVYAALEEREQVYLARTRQWAAGAIVDPRLRIECLLAEGETEAASGLVAALGSPLAADDKMVLLFLPHRPELALQMARAWAEAMFAQRGADHSVYRAVTHLIRQFLVTGSIPGCAAWIDELRLTHRRRPSFLALLNDATLVVERISPI
ncbi:MAG: hypothetical protein RR758_00165 [Burkholderiaceae bacterium]